MKDNYKACVLDANCPSQKVLDLIADKWTALIIYALADGAKRHSELQRKIGGVSQKMLTQCLRNMERSGLVERKVYPVVPPMVEYSLTSLGSTLIEPLRVLCQWAEKHMPDLLAAQSSFELSLVHQN
jgi:DNA-binding HxlR family transcriptional regulator